MASTSPLLATHPSPHPTDTCCHGAIKRQNENGINLCRVDIMMIINLLSPLKHLVTGVFNLLLPSEENEYVSRGGLQVNRQYDIHRLTSRKKYCKKNGQWSTKATHSKIQWMMDCRLGVKG